MSFGVNLFFPMLPPIIIFDFFLLNLETTASTPSLLKPILFITAWSFFNLKSLGFGFPSCARGVTVPISTKPKPKVSNPSKISASLSNPAANPTGLSKFKPNTVLFNDIFLVIKKCFQNANDEGIENKNLRKIKLILCIFSGSKKNKKKIKNF